MRVFGLNLKQEYADLFGAAILASEPNAIAKALSECGTPEIEILEWMLNEYYRITSALREHGASSIRNESAAILLSASSAPVLTSVLPSLSVREADLPPMLILAQLSYPDRRFDFDINVARGYMIERLILRGNVWERAIEEYQWLGENHRVIARVASDLEARGSVDRKLILELARNTTPLVRGAL